MYQSQPRHVNARIQDLWIKPNGEIGYYEGFTWKENVGLINYYSGYGAQRDIINLNNIGYEIKPLG